MYYTSIEAIQAEQAYRAESAHRAPTLAWRRVQPGSRARRRRGGGAALR